PLSHRRGACPDRRTARAACLSVRAVAAGRRGAPDRGAHVREPDAVGHGAEPARRDRAAVANRSRPSPAWPSAPRPNPARPNPARPPLSATPGELRGTQGSIDVRPSYSADAHRLQVLRGRARVRTYEGRGFVRIRATGIARKPPTRWPE